MPTRGRRRARALHRRSPTGQIVSDGSAIYWVDDGVVHKMATPSGVPSGTAVTLATCTGLSTVAPDCGRFNGIAVDATYLYWTDEGTSYGGGGVYRVTKN